MRKTKVKYVPGGTRESKWKALSPADKAYWSSVGQHRPKVKLTSTVTYKDEVAEALWKYVMREGLNLDAVMKIALEEYFAVRGIELKEAELPDGQWAYYRQLALGEGTPAKS